MLAGSSPDFLARLEAISIPSIALSASINPYAAIFSDGNPKGSPISKRIDPSILTNLAVSPFGFVTLEIKRRHRNKKSPVLDKKGADIHKDLINACKANSSKAQYEIYKLYYKAMYNTSVRIMNNSADAEDVMQESFLDAFRKIDQYTGSGSFGGWLKRIVVNNSLDAIKRSKE